MGGIWTLLEFKTRNSYIKFKQHEAVKVVFKSFSPLTKMISVSDWMAWVEIKVSPLCSWSSNVPPSPYISYHTETFTITRPFLQILRIPITILPLPTIHHWSPLLLHLLMVLILIFLHLFLPNRLINLTYTRYQRVVYTNPILSMLFILLIFLLFHLILNLLFLTKIGIMLWLTNLIHCWSKTRGIWYLTIIGCH